MKIKNAFLFVLAVLVVSAAPAGAAGPLANCSSGQPFRWGTGASAFPSTPTRAPSVP